MVNYVTLNVCISLRYSIAVLVYVTQLQYYFTLLNCSISLRYSIAVLVLSYSITNEHDIQ